LSFAAGILAPLALGRHRAALARLGLRDILLSAAAGVFLAVHFAAWISSLEYTTVAASVVLVSTGPLWVALLAPAILGERLTRGVLLGLFLAVLGAFIIAVADACTWHTGLACTHWAGLNSGSGLWGSFLAIVGAWAVSGYLIAGRRLRHTLPLVPYVFLVYGISAVVLAGAAIVSGRLQLRLSAATYLWIMLLAIVPQLIGHSTYNWALRYLPATIVAVTTLGEPIGSAILAYAILDEIPSTLVILGAVLVLVGIYLAARAARQPDQGAGTDEGAML
jgi:drug/metabolite transporter (DMT)-like permease